LKWGLANMFFLGCPAIMIIPNSASHIAWSLHPAIGWDGISWNFCLSLSTNMIFPFSAYALARITSMSHQHLTWLGKFKRRRKKSKSNINKYLFTNQLYISLLVNHYLHIIVLWENKMIT
jgi:hypothetical protein